LSTTLIIGNQQTSILNLTTRIVRVLEKVCSYRVAGYMFAPAWRNKVWDGKEHLFKFSKSTGYTVPTGLAIAVVKALKEMGVEYTVKDATVIRSKRTVLDFRAHELRDYQKEAIKSILSPPFVGRGIIKMPVRSGKTLTAAAITARFGLPTLFGVPSKGLLHQTYEVFSNFFPGVKVGRIGDGIYQPGYITIATMQTLLKLRGRNADHRKSIKAIARDSRYDELMQMYDAIILDEVHRIRGGGSWHEVAYDFDARYKIGLSATAFLENEEEQSKGAIWMIATCGPMRVDIPVSRLVESGHLMKQNVDIYTVRAPDMKGAGWSNTMRVACIDTNRSRNQTIARLAKQHVDSGLRVLVIARHRPHIAMLHEELEALGLTVSIVHGGTSQSKRDQAAEDLASKTIDVVVGNVFGEGIDLPAVEVVINAEGGKGDIQTVQRQRNLTISEGKKKAILIDFLDLTNETLEKHSRARLEMYRSESSFKIRLH
jgi:superfamily II DNA or RNA helicase